MSSRCQTSTNTPSFARKISWPDMVTGRPVGGMPSRSSVPVWVPDMVQRPVTKSSRSKATSRVNTRSGNALRTERAAHTSPARPRGWPGTALVEEVLREQLVGDLVLARAQISNSHRL